MATPKNRYGRTTTICVHKLSKLHHSIAKIYVLLRILNSYWCDILGITLAMHLCRARTNFHVESHLFDLFGMMIVSVKFPNAIWGSIRRLCSFL